MNTASSLAYCLAGAHLVAHATDPPRGPSDASPAPASAESEAVRIAALRAYGVVLVATGVGSMLFHGPGGRMARWAHDAPIVGLAAGVVAWDAYDGGVVGARTAGVAAATTAAAGAAVLAVAPDRSLPVQVAAAGGAVATEAAVRLAARRGSRGASARTAPRSRRRERASVGVLLGSAVLHGLGRTGAPLCRPDSPLQLHAAWHIGSAAALAMWAKGAMGSVSGPADDAAGRR